MNPERTPEELGEAVSSLRRDLGMSQERLASKAEVTKTTIQNIESGRYKRPSSLENIANALGVTVEALTNRHGADSQDEAEAEDEDVEQLMRRVRQMPREDRRALLRLLRASDQMPPPERTAEEPPEERRH